MSRIQLGEGLINYLGVPSRAILSTNTVEKSK